MFLVTVVTATVIAAGMSFTVVMVVMIAFCFGIIIQIVFEEGLYCLVCITDNTTVQFDTFLRQSHLGTTTDTAGYAP